MHLSEPDTAAGFLELTHARIRWLLSVNHALLPEPAKSQGKRTYRSVTVDGESCEFSEGFTDLHTASYEQILVGTRLCPRRGSIQHRGGA